MADGFQVDFSDVLRLAASIEEAPAAASRRIRQAVVVTARNVKDDWQEPLKGSATIPGGARSVSYDITGGHGIRAEEIRADIGPVLEGQGPIVGMLEYGTPSIGPRGYGAAALEKNQEDFQRGLQIALEQAEREAGL
jgi:hypothetical protein